MRRWLRSGAYTARYNVTARCGTATYGIKIEVPAKSRWFRIAC